MSPRHVDPSALNGLAAFRQAAYECLTAQPDVLFELCDALLLSPHVSSFIEVTLCPAFHRKWSSAYPALKLARWTMSDLADCCWMLLPKLKGPSAASITAAG